MCGVYWYTGLFVICIVSCMVIGCKTWPMNEHDGEKLEAKWK